MAEHTTHNAPHSTAEQRQMGRKHVFCVNGSSVFLDLVRDLLEVESYNITTTNFVPRTHDLIAVLRPDIVIVDVVVGIRAGWELLEQLRTAVDTRDIPLLVTSTSPTLLARAEELATPNGRKHYLAMPFDNETLIKLVASLIGPA